jgi:hypothetical protein
LAALPLRTIFQGQPLHPKTQGLHGDPDAGAETEPTPWQNRQAEVNGLQGSPSRHARPNMVFSPLHPRQITIVSSMLIPFQIQLPLSPALDSVANSHALRRSFHLFPAMRARSAPFTETQPRGKSSRELKDTLGIQLAPRVRWQLSHSYEGPWKFRLCLMTPLLPPYGHLLS